MRTLAMIKLFQSAFFVILVSAGSLSLAAGYSVETSITSIQVQDNRTWIDFDPGLGGATTCANKTGVEISNEGSPSSNPNRDLIMSIALAAIASGKKVIWITSDNCSNVDRDLIRGVRIVD